MRRVLSLVASLALANLSVAIEADSQSGILRGVPWTLHVIDDSLAGADGVKIRDIDRDGRIDVVSGWEESGVTRVYLNPGQDNVRLRWPAVTIGETPSVEDAAFVDINNDGILDVVASCEGDERTVFVLVAPTDS